MKLWLVSVNKHLGYDAWDSFICTAETQAEALRTHPNASTWPGRFVWDDDQNCWLDGGEPTPGWDTSWTTINRLTAVHIGEALPNTAGGQVLLASFNAG